MASIITIGSRMAERCATCMYWEGPNVVTSAGSLSNPKRMKLDSKPYNGTCIKKRTTKHSTSSCNEHEYHYRFQRYL